MYAVVETGGKQYRVMVGETVEVERLQAGVGETIELGRVLMVADGDTVQLAKNAPGARVTATVLAHDLARKVLTFKYRAKEHYRRKVGHRQEITRLRITDIQA